MSRWSLHLSAVGLRDEELADLVLSYLGKTATKEDLTRYFKEHSVTKQRQSVFLGGARDRPAGLPRRPFHLNL